MTNNWFAFAIAMTNSRAKRIEKVQRNVMTPSEKPDNVLKALEWFKDWSNYLLVTTVAATGWVADKALFWSPLLKSLCVWSLGISIVCGIFTLALVPLISQNLDKHTTSIYKVRVHYAIFGCSYSAYLTQMCRPQHVSFILGILFYCWGTVGWSTGLQIQWPAGWYRGRGAGLIIVFLAILYGYFSKPEDTKPAKTGPQQEVKEKENDLPLLEESE